MTHVEGRIWVRQGKDGKNRYYYRRIQQIFENGLEKKRDIRVSIGNSVQRAAAEAKKLDEQYEAELRGEKPRRDVTLKEFAEWYIGHARDERRLLAWKTVRGALRALLAHFGDVPIRRITRLDMERYLNKRAGVVRAATANSNVRDARRMFNVAIDEGCLDVNPAVRIRPLRVERLPVRLPVAEEVGLLLDNLKRRGDCMHMLVLILIGTGCRLGEALGMVWSDVDFTREVLNLRRRKVNDIHQLPLTGPLKSALWELWAERGMPKTGPVIVDARGKALGRYTGHAAFKTACARIGMSWLTLRTFRKFAATTVAERTGDVRLAQQLLGHTTVRTTELYLGRADEARRRAAGSMADLLTDLGLPNGTPTPKVGGPTSVDGTKDGTPTVLAPSAGTGEDKKKIN